MDGGKVIITNNPMVLIKYRDAYRIDYRDVSCIEVFKAARNMVHKGHRLLTHPLSGGVKPNVTLYKTVLLTLNPIQPDEGGVDFQSLRYIEESMAAAQKFLQTGANNNQKEWNAKTHEDFQTVDLSFIEGCIDR